MDAFIRVLNLLPRLNYDELRLVAQRTAKLRILTPKSGANNGSKQAVLEGQNDKVVSSSSTSTAVSEEATAVIQFLNEKSGKNFRATGVNLTFVEARLRSGATPEQCRGVVVRKCREWLGTSQAIYLRPATLFNAEKFEQYLGEIGGKN